MWSDSARGNLAGRCGPCSSHAGSKQHGILHRARMGNAPAGDIIGRPVCRGQQGEWKSAEQCHPLIEADQLHRDLALIVVHGQDRIELALPGPGKYRVGWEWTFAGDTFALRFDHGRLNHFDLFASEIAAVARMGVESRDSNSR